MPDCIFCKIIAGEMPCYKIYEDDKYLAFLDIFPFTKGHTLVVTKKHYRWIWDIEDIGEYMQVCRQIALHYQKISQEELVLQLAIGEAVPHAHIHLMPGLDKDKQVKVIKQMINVDKKQLKEKEAKELVELLKMDECFLGL